MERANDIKDSRKGKHLIREERIVIEVMLKNLHSKAEIARCLGRSTRCIEREVNMGLARHLESDLTESMIYNADRAQDVHDRNARAKGPSLKLDDHPEIADYVSGKILKDGYSPDVIAHLIRKEKMAGAVCTKTLYAYIDMGLIPGVSNDTLWEKNYRRAHGKGSKKRFKEPVAERTSIEKRPDEVAGREVFGHWEIDLVVGGKGASKAVLLTLTERKTRRLIVRKLKDKTQASVLKALRAIESQMGAGKFRAQFKTITSDNGTEFLDVEAMEQSALSKKTRVKMYYAHPYSSWERGTNENTNRMIRRFISKGSDIGKLTLKYIRKVEDWINNYPRKILEYKTAIEAFEMEISA